MTDDTKTLRQEIADLLDQGEWGFEELRDHLGLTVKRLEDDLRHVERSIRSTGRRLRVEPARCADCGFRLRVKAGRFSTPSRCPRCRHEGILPTRLRLG